jgi:hypothetical protein
MMRVSPFTVAEEALHNSDVARGITGMERTSAPMGPNMFDGGPASKVSENTQPFNNSRMQEQSIQQNTLTGMQQHNANAVQQVRKGNLVQDNAEYKANALLEERKGEILSVMNAPATLAMGNMSPPQAEKLRSDMAVSKAMAMGASPDLAQEAIATRRYG